MFFILLLVLHSQNRQSVVLRSHAEAVLDIMAEVRRSVEIHQRRNGVDAHGRVVEQPSYLLRREAVYPVACAVVAAIVAYLREILRRDAQLVGIPVDLTLLLVFAALQH